MPFHRPFELQGGQPAEDFGHRKLELSGHFGGVKSQNVREVGKDAIALPPQLESQALWRRQRVVQDLAAQVQGGEHVARVLHQARAVAKKGVRSHRQG